jgi:integrase/recombinase XerD
MADDFKRLKGAFYRDLMRRGIKKTTLKSIYSHLNIFYGFLEEKDITDLTRIKRRTVLEFQNHINMEQDDAGRNVYSAAYRCCVLGTVRTFLKTLYRLDFIAVDYSLWIDNPKKPRRLSKNIFTVKEIRDLLARCAPKTAYEFTAKVFFAVLYGTGIRIGEALRLAVKDINFKEGLIRLTDSKAGRKRLVPFGSVVRDYLKLYIKHIRPYFEKEKTKGLLFAPRRGKSMTDEVLHRCLAVFLKRAGIDKKITSHCFRHSYCSHLLASGLGIREIAELAGHHNLDVTAGYAKAVTEDLVEVVKKNHPRERDKERILKDGCSFVQKNITAF